MIRILLIALCLFTLSAPAWATPSEDVTVGLDRLAGESDEAFYDRLFAECGSWLPPYEQVKDAAKAKLIEIGAVTLPTLIPHWYSSNNVRHRVTMEEIITGIGVPAVPMLLPYIAADDPIMRQRIVTSLGGLDDPSVLPALQQQLEIETDVQVIPALFDALGKRGVDHPEIIPSIAAHLGHADERVRRTGAVALGRIGSMDAVASLLPLLSDDLFSVRYPARDAIWSLCWENLSNLPPLPQTDSDPLATALWQEMDVAFRLQMWKNAPNLVGNELSAATTDWERIAILRGIYRAWRIDHERPGPAIALFDQSQPSPGAEAVRLELRAAVATTIAAEAAAPPPVQ
ncbi:MAG: HEAT repeat domain-containing protein [bacterium]